MREQSEGVKEMMNECVNVELTYGRPFTRYEEMAGLWLQLTS